LQIIARIVLCEGSNYRTNAVRTPVFLIDDYPSRFPDLVEDSFIIERSQRAQIYYLDAQFVFLFQTTSNIQRNCRHTRVAYHCQIAALLSHLSLANGHHVVTIGHPTLNVTEGKVLEKDHRVVVTHRGT